MSCPGRWPAAAELLGRDRLGAATGIDLEKMLAPGRRAGEVLGPPLQSDFPQAGPVPHKGIEYDKQKGVLGATK